MKKYINGLHHNRSEDGDFPPTVLRSSKFTFTYLKDCIQRVLGNIQFTGSLKLSDIVPAYKKKDPTDKSNSQTISILLLISKGFWESYIFINYGTIMNKCLNRLLCGLRKAHSKQHALFRSLQARQKKLDQCGFVGTILMDLSKAYDCLPHDLLIVKLRAWHC